MSPRSPLKLGATVVASVALLFASLSASLTAQETTAAKPTSDAPKLQPPPGVVPPPVVDSKSAEKIFGKAPPSIAAGGRVFGNSSEPAAIAIVDKYLAAIGGRDMLVSIADRQAKFRNIKFSATGQTEAVIALYMKGGHKYREEWEIKGFKIKDEPLAFKQIYNGEIQEGWVQMLGTVSALEGRTLGVFVWDKYLDDFFAQWKENGYSLRKAGEGLVEEDECNIVECRDFTGRQKIRYFFAKDSGLLLKKEWFDVSGKTTVKKEQFYQIYRRITFADGTGKAIHFPLQLDIHVDGELDTRRVYTQVRYNAKLSDKIFAKPEGVPFAPEIRSSKDLKKIGAAAPAVGPQPQGKAGTRSEGSKSRKRRPGRAAHPPVSPKKAADANKAPTAPKTPAKGAP